MLAAIPYTTFPDIELGPLTLRTFGLMVALGVLLGAWIAAMYAERFGVPRDDTYRVGTWMVLAGIIGSRLTWAATHTDQIENPVDVIAIWEGGIQFSGGFICALIVGLPFFRRWKKLLRWQVLDGYALGLSIGLALGRVGCYAVGEHFGRTTDFFLASRYDGGNVREPSLGDVPLVPGTTFHNTSLYEFIYMVVLFAGMGALVLAARRRGREVTPGTLVGIFVLYYGVLRFISDSFRVNDERVAGMTGAQWMCLVMVPAGVWILLKVRPRLAALASAEAAAAGTTEDDDAAGDETAVTAADETGDETADADDTGTGTRDEIAGDKSDGDADAVAVGSAGSAGEIAGDESDGDADAAGVGSAGSAGEIAGDESDGEADAAGVGSAGSAGEIAGDESDGDADAGSAGSAVTAGETAGDESDGGSSGAEADRAGAGTVGTAGDTAGDEAPVEKTATVDVEGEGGDAVVVADPDGTEGNDATTVPRSEG